MGSAAMCSATSGGISAWIFLLARFLVSSVSANFPVPYSFRLVMIVLFHVHTVEFLSTRIHVNCIGGKIYGRVDHFRMLGVVQMTIVLQASSRQGLAQSPAGFPRSI